MAEVDAVGTTAAERASEPVVVRPTATSPLLISTPCSAGTVMDTGQDKEVPGAMAMVGQVTVPIVVVPLTIVTRSNVAGTAPVFCTVTLPVRVPPRLAARVTFSRKVAAWVPPILIVAGVTVVPRVQAEALVVAGANCSPASVTVKLELQPVKVTGTFSGCVSAPRWSGVVTTRPTACRMAEP